MDCDGRLSRSELLSGISHMLSIKTLNSPPPDTTTTTTTTTHNGGAGSQEGGAHAEGGVSVGAATETGEGEETAEDIADSALKKYGLENVSGQIFSQWGPRPLWDTPSLGHSL